MAIKGLQTLYNLILKDIVKGSGQASGILSIGKDVRKLADKKLQRYITTAKKQGVDLDSLSEQEIKYMLEMNRPKGPTIGGHQIIDASSSEGQEITRNLFNMLDRQSGKNVIKADFGKPFAEETGSVDNIIKNIKTMKPIESMKETNKVLKGEGKYKNLSKADREKIAGDESVTDHIFERNIEPDPEDFAYGGVAGMLGERTGYNEGKTAKKSFIKLIPQFTEKGEQIPVFSKTGKQQIEGAPEGITSDKEVFNLIVGLDIPINDKINILGDIGFSKFRDKIEKGDEELFLADPAGNINKNIGIGYEDDGLSGSIMYNPDTKYKQFQISKKFADGGIARQNFAMGRRAFMKLLGGAAAGIGALKTGILGFGKGTTKQVAKDLTQVPIQNAEGMPSWFKPLVNRVIKEGTETTNLAPNKGGAYLDRQIVHSAKLGEGQGVRVYQTLDDQTIRVEYQSADNMGGVDDGIVHLEYTAPKVLEGPIKKGQPTKTKSEFSASEAYPYQDPKDYKYVTFEGDNTVRNVDGLYSDTSALKQFGTNKTLSKKELEIAKQKRKRVKKINEDPGGEELAPLYDPPDYASGGIARMLGE